MKTFEPSWNRGSSPIPQQQITSRRFSSLVVISSGRHGFHKWCLLRNSSSQMENYALLTWDRSMGFFQPLYIATPGFHSTLKERSGGQTYRQGCNRPLRVQKADRHHGTLVIAWRKDYFFSATRMHIPDQRSCPNPGGGVALRGITPTFFAVN